jgi:hypothetical protein
MIGRLGTRVGARRMWRRAFRNRRTIHTATSKCDPPAGVSLILYGLVQFVTLMATFSRCCLTVHGVERRVFPVYPGEPGVYRRVLESRREFMMLEARV